MRSTSHGLITEATKGTRSTKLFVAFVFFVSFVHEPSAVRAL